jgi:hypothetical protein
MPASRAQGLLEHPHKAKIRPIIQGVRGIWLIFVL